MIRDKIDLSQIHNHYLRHERHELSDRRAQAARGTATGFAH
jgi:hypothetical protein